MIFIFYLSCIGPALRFLPQRMERQLPAAAPAAGLHPPHSARPYLPSSSRQPHTLCRPPATARPSLLCTFRACGPPLAFAVPTTGPSARLATRLQSSAPPRHQRGHQPQAAPLAHPSPAGPVQSPLSPALLHGVARLRRLPPQPQQTQSVPVHLSWSPRQPRARSQQ